MNVAGIAVVILGVMVLTQIFGGQALQRMTIIPTEPK